jgi:hypothetical protein
LAKVKTAMMKAAMSGLYHTGAHRLLAPYTQGVGVIFTLHHVRPEPEEPRAFAPNRILEVAPQFLDAVLDQVQEAGLDVISLDQAVQRLKDGDDRRFACFTFDDGYRDNLVTAVLPRPPLPALVPTDYPDGTGSCGRSRWKNRRPRRRDRALPQRRAGGCRSTAAKTRA